MSLLLSIVLFALLAPETLPQTATCVACDDIIAICADGSACINPTGGPLAGCCAGTTTTAATTVAATNSSTSCVDLLNPLTGASDCPARASLCNDTTYFAVMTQQCPRTCGRCSSVNQTSIGCVDKLNPLTGSSDCPARASLCNNATYLAVMTDQCPRTCGRCNATSTATGTVTGTASITSGCVDMTNPSTNASECTARAALCNSTVYFNLMTIQCPVTCNRCNVTITGPFYYCYCIRRLCIKCA